MDRKGKSEIHNRLPLLASGPHALLSLSLLAPSCPVLQGLHFLIPKLRYPLLQIFARLVLSTLQISAFMALPREAFSDPASEVHSFIHSHVTSLICWRLNCLLLCLLCVLLSPECELSASRDFHLFYSSLNPQGSEQCPINKCSVNTD